MHVFTFFESLMAEMPKYGKIATLPYLFLSFPFNATSFSSSKLSSSASCYMKIEGKIRFKGNASGEKQLKLYELEIKDIVINTKFSRRTADNGEILPKHYF